MPEDEESFFSNYFAVGVKHVRLSATSQNLIAFQVLIRSAV
jgi:hypothetical protein